jgi:ketosteroid isomerase-like protein
MKRFISMLAAGLLFPALAAAQSAPTAERSPNIEQQIADYEAALGQAMIHKDVATLTALVADDWTIQSDSGSMGSKAGFLSDVKSGMLVVATFKLHDLHVHVLGNVAFVQGFDDETSSYNGKDNSGTYNWLDVWQNRNGRWVSVATQLTRVNAGH